MGVRSQGECGVPPLCRTLLQFTVHCVLRRSLRKAHKDDLEIGNSG
jgi:hypothetical protein